jgi:large subunit ribosomal protein L7/L12
MSKLEKLVDELSTLTVLEAAELSKLLEEKWGVSAAAPPPAGARLLRPKRSKSKPNSPSC